ncbi:MAG TPA: carboxypeptidase regulatory-like domain-containing protein [Thermoanaerobaculia bacterium]
MKTPLKALRPGRLVLLLPVSLALSASAGEIRGRLLVSDRGDRPAAGVTVSAVAWETPGEEARREAKAGPASAAPKPFAAATTGADGSFALSVPAEAGKERLFRVQAEGAGVVPILFEDVYDTSESDDLGEHLLSRAEKISGTAVDASGAPLAGAEVVLEPGGGGPGDPSLRTLARIVVTGADGVFRFEEAGATGNRITVMKDGLAPARSSGLRAGGLAKPIALAAGFPIAGVVRDAARRSVAGALVRFEGVKATTRWALTDAEGAFSIPNAPDGRGSLVVDAGDSGWAARPDVKLPLPDGRALTVTLAAPSALTGKVVEDKTGKPVPRAKLLLKGNAFARLVRAAPDGTYALKGVPPETYRLAVDEARHVPWVQAALALAPGEAKKLDIALTLGASLAGKVVDESGAPVAAARGTLTRGGESGVAGLRRMLRIGAETTAFRTRPDGTFTASRLAPGDNQRLFVSHAEFERATLAGLSLPAGGTKAGVTVVLKRGATITGFVKDGADQPLADVEVQVDPSVNFRGGAGGVAMNVVRLGGASARPKTKTGADGAFAIKGISVGEYALVLKKPGFATERVDPVKVAEQGVEPVLVTMGPGASISGAVRRRNGEGVEGFLVRAGEAAGGGRGGRGGGGGPGAGLLNAIGADNATGVDGGFFIDGLKAGQAYDLSAFGGGGMGPQKRGVVAPAAGVDIVVSGTGRIAGVALDARTGQPLRNFSVSYEPDRGGGMVIRMVARGAGAQTGIGQKRDFQAEDGAFALEDVPAGTWTVVLDAKGYQTARVASLAVDDGGTKDGVEVRATPGTLLKGRVSDAKTGRPVANAAVSWEPAGAGGGGPGGMFGRGGPLGLDGGDETTTDAEGAFTVEGIAAGRVKVTAKSPDYADGSEVADVKETGGSVEIKLASGGSVGGVVVSGNQPVPGASVSLAGAGEAGFGRILGGGQTTTSDATGRFVFDHLVAGRYSASAGLNGKSSNLSEVVLQSGDTRSDLVLSLSAGSTIQGVVAGLPDGWKSQTTVIATGVESFFATTKVGSDGSFQVTGVPAGPVTLRAQAGDGMGTSRSATKQVTAADDVPLLQTEIVFDVGFTLSGRVTRASQPLANAMVVANLQGGGGRQATARTDESGAYVLQGLQEGSYAVSASADPLTGGGASMVRQTVSLTGDQSLDLTFPTAKVAGLVTDSDTKQPLADVTVGLSAPPAANGSGGVQRMTQTDSTGRFQFTDIAPQAYTLNASKPDYQYDKRAITAADDGSSENLAVELARGQGIEIQARDGLAGVPMRSVSVRVLDGTKAAVYAGTISLDSNGAGEITSLKPGGYSLFVNASGYATVYVASVSVPSRALAVTLTPGGSADISVGPKSFVNGILRGTLRTAAGMPYPYTLFATDGRLAITADASGQTGFRRLTNLAPGSYVLALDGGGGTTFTVGEGGITPVKLP